MGSRSRIRYSVWIRLIFLRVSLLIILFSGSAATKYTAQELQSSLIYSVGDLYKRFSFLSTSIYEHLKLEPLKFTKKLGCEIEQLTYKLKALFSPEIVLHVPQPYNYSHGLKFSLSRILLAEINFYLLDATVAAVPVQWSLIFYTRIA